MEKEISDLSVGLMLWQVFLVLAIIFIVYYLVKAYKMIKRIKERLDEE